MNEQEIRERLEEERREAPGWADVLTKFTEGRFSELRCPHCQTARQFEYLLHENGFTVRCAVCGRFVHGSGGKPAWVGTEAARRGGYTPVPN